MIIKFLHLFLITLLLVISLNCSDNVSGGSAGEVGNPKVALFVSNSDGTPAESVSVLILKSDFNPIEETLPLPILTDENGFVEFVGLDLGSYTISCLETVSGKSFINMSAAISNEKIDTVFDTLGYLGEITFILPDTIDTVGRYFYLSGTPYSIPLNFAKQTEDGLLLSIKNLPEGIVPPLILHNKSLGLDTEVLQDSIIVIGNDSITIAVEIDSKLITNSFISDTFSGVYGLASDTDGKYWLACGEGVVYGNGTSWSVYRANTGDYKGDSIYTVLVDKNNVIWYGGNGGILRHYTNDLGGYWQVWNSDGIVLPNDTITAMVENWDGSSVWLSTYDGITICEVLDSNNVNPITIPSDSIKFNLKNVTAMTYSNSDGVWIGTSDGQLNHVSSVLSIGDYKLDSSGIDTSSIVDLAEGLDSTLWIVTNVNVILLKDGVWSFVDPQVYGYQNIEEVRINRFDGSVWFRSSHSLYRYNNGNGYFVSNSQLTSPLLSINFLDSSAETGYIGTSSGFVIVK